MTYECTPERFLKDVKDHVMTVKLDDGVFRRITFGKPESSNMWFCIITAPNVLLYYGDMGTYVFSRIEDMFEFFRSAKPITERFTINPQYWAEKVLAKDRHHDTEVFSEERWKEAIRDDVKQYLEQYADDGEGEWFKLARVLWPAVKEDLIGRGASNIHEAIDAAMRFSIETPYDGIEHPWPQSITEHRPKKHHPFADFYEHKLTEYGYHYVWCCFALVWSIQKYDDSKTKGETGP